jgi:HSP20 family molecular chaperone IbpA
LAWFCQVGIKAVWLSKVEGDFQDSPLRSPKSQFIGGNQMPAESSKSGAEHSGQPEINRPVETNSVRYHLIMQTPAWNPPTDVYETEDSIIVRVEVAGMRDEDFSIELEGRSLVVQGVRQDTPERRAFHQMEIPFGDFQVAVVLPYPIESSQVEALYANGFLRVILPKARPRQIPIGD